jgi:putative aminopeptidase FrvX
MNSESKKFLYQLLNTPSPTGAEQEIQKVVKKRMSNYARVIEKDVHGNLLVGINTKATRKVLLAGHCDQIGFIVKHISKDGFVYVDALGGIDTTVLPGTPIVINGSKGDVYGVVGHKPIHLQPADKRGQLSLPMSAVWIDIGAKDQKEAQKKVNVGDTAVFKPSVAELSDDLIVAPGLDNRVGLFVVMEALRMCANTKLNVALYAVSTVQEEVGLRGAITSTFSIDPEVGIAVDVTHANDNPGFTDDKQPPCHLGKGPVLAKGPNVNPVLVNKLQTIAKQNKIPHQLSISGGLLGNDAREIQVSRSGVATAAIGLPNRYMHTQAEVCSLKDIENSAKLIAGFVKSLTAKFDFRP